MDALGRMPLLEPHPPVFGQPLVDLRLPGVQLRCRSPFSREGAVEIFDLHVLGHGLPVEVEPAGDLLRPQPLSLKLLDLINLIHSEHVSSL